MIRCKLVEYTNPDATQSVARVDRAVSGETLSLGRAAACKIYLPDPRVRLEHAWIRRAEDGLLYMEAAGPVLFNRHAQTSVRLAVGQKITIGPYDFAVESVDDGPGRAIAQITLSFSQRALAAVPAGQVKAQAHSGITPGWITRRRLSWMLALLVLVFASVLPVWHVFDEQAFKAPATDPHSRLAQARVWVQTGVAKLDTFWNPGQVSSAHNNFAQDCRACHDKPFERVADASCTSCHKNTGTHVADKAIEHATFPGQRCATCHKEHQGTAGMRTPDAIGCEACHADIKAYSPLTALGNVSDFAKDHPPFRLSIRAPGAAGAVVRTAQTTHPRNDTGLKFPHDIHLARTGIKSPNGPATTGGRVVQVCADCHRLDAAGVRYEPVRMDKHCQACHRLSVDPQAPERQVPHASPAQVSTAVREIYASLAVDRYPVPLVTVNSLLQRPQAAPTAAAPTSAGRWVREQSVRAVNAMFDQPAGVCKTCHETQKRLDPVSKTVGWQVRPIISTDHWLPKSRFSHAQHKNAACTNCHEAQGSKAAADILIPGLQTCQTCHAGARLAGEKIVSRCDSCHGFHGKTENPILRQSAAGTGTTP